MKKLFLLSLVLFLVHCKSHENSKLQVDSTRPNVIYGEDHRFDLNDVSETSIKELARSTVALFSTENLVYDQVFDQYLFENPDDSLPYCPNEKFRREPRWAFCSGSLIGKDVILTAGHCVRDVQDCKKTKFIFDYAMTTEKVDINSASATKVFSCQEIIYTTEKKGAADFAVIRLDREVIGRKILKLATQDADFKTTLMMIGHPAGMPTKITKNGKVRSLINNDFIVASIDSFAGNSGSSVFDQNTLEIVGVLARGEADYEREKACYKAKVCDEEGCRGEDITRVSVIRRITNTRP